MKAGHQTLPGFRPPASKLPRKIGRYRVVKMLGRGGMGVVFLGQDPFIDRQVAIKTSLEAPPSDPLEFDQYQQAFFNEARAAGKLMHRNIVSVYDASVDIDHSYLVMEYVNGTHLGKFTSNKNLLPLQKVINTIFLCAKALNYAHEQGVIHRDIKPRNILLTKNGQPKISDFGIAAVRGGSSLQDTMVHTTGSVFYSSPEQLRKESLTGQSDIFSLGVCLYELLTGRKPFYAENDIGVFYKITTEEPEPLRTKRPDIPESLERIVNRCLSKDLGNRYQNGLQLAQALIASFDHLKNLREELDQQEKLNVLKKINFFKEFTTSELTEVIRATQFIKFSPASKIIEEGAVEDSFYIIVAGEVVVRKRGRSLANLKPGDVFGEMAYLGKTKRTATILSASNTILMKLNASIMEKTSMSTQLRFYKVFSKVLIDRLTEASDRISRGY